MSATFTPTPNDNTAAFLPKVKDGANSHESEFLHTTKLLLGSYPSFTLQDCIGLTRGAGLEVREVKKLFESWTARLVRSGHLKQIQGAYNDDIFLVQTV